MKRVIVGHWVLAWVGLVPLMIVNGVVRVAVYGPSMSELSAHQLSSATGIVILVIYTWLVLPWLRLASPREAWTVGVIWLLLTMTFEFLFGHLVAGHPWPRLVHDYNLLEGRVWILVVVAIIVAPRIIFRIRYPGPTA